MLFVFPDTIPVHFDINGVVDRWGSKYEILIMPAMAVICMLMFKFFTKLYTDKASETTDDKEKAEMLSNIKVMNITVWIMSVLFFVMNIITLYTSYSQLYPDMNLPEFDVIQAVSIIMGIVFIVMGNYMPKTRRNSTIGFRFPWTLYNDTTWSKSNKFASYVMVVAGIVSIIGALFIKGITATIVMLGSILISIPIIMIYAYIVYRNERNKDNEETDKG
jgi:uncharacterized membrane protein